MKRSRKAIAKGKIVHELDGLVRQFVFARDGNMCVVCKKPSPTLQAAHILPKGRVPLLRFEPYNIMTMCLYHHLHWWHKDVLEAYNWFDATYPGKMENLQIMARTAPRLDMKLLRIVLQKEVEALGAEKLNG